MWKGGISFLSHQRGWIIRRSYCGHSRSFDVLTAAGCRGGATTNQRPGVSRWGLPPFAPLGKKDSLPLHWKSNGSPISADVVEVEYVAAMEAKKEKELSLKAKHWSFFLHQHLWIVEEFTYFRTGCNRNNTLYKCYNIWNKGKDRKEDGRKQRKSGRIQRTDPFPSSLSVYWTVIMNNTLHM